MSIADRIRESREREAKAPSGWEVLIRQCGVNSQGRQMWCAAGASRFEEQAKREAEWINHLQENGARFRDALEVAVSAIENNCECEDSTCDACVDLEKIERVLEGE